MKIKLTEQELRIAKVQFETTLEAFEEISKEDNSGSKVYGVDLVELRRKKAALESGTVVEIVRSVFDRTSEDDDIAHEYLGDVTTMMTAVKRLKQARTGRIR